MTPKDIAESIARDASCAQGEFNQRVLAILPYLNGIERLTAEKERLRASLGMALYSLCVDDYETQQSVAETIKCSYQQKESD